MIRAAKKRVSVSLHCEIRGSLIFDLLTQYDLTE